MANPELTKQVSVFVPMSDYRLIRDEALRLNLPMTQLLRRWIDGELKRLKKEAGKGD